MADAIKSRPAWRTLNFHVQQRLTAEQGLALAEAVQCNSLLETFGLSAMFGTSAALKEFLLAMARAMMHQKSLISLHMILQRTPGFVHDASGESLQEAVLAFLDVLKGHPTLTVLKLEGFLKGLPHPVAVASALVDCVRHNFVLRTCYFDTKPDHPEENVSIINWCWDPVQRNLTLCSQQQALSAIARFSDASTFRNLTELAFRTKVFSYLLPPGCRCTPWNFAKAVTIHNRKHDVPIRWATCEIVGAPIADEGTEAEGVGIDDSRISDILAIGETLDDLPRTKRVKLSYTELRLARY